MHSDFSLKNTLLTTYYNNNSNNNRVVMLGYDWWLCMVINISVQHNGGFLPDNILLTQGYYHLGTRLNNRGMLRRSRRVLIFSLNM